MEFPRVVRIVSAVALAALAASCHSNPRSVAAASPTAGAIAAAPMPSLYQRLGGSAGVHALTSQLVDNAVADPRIGHFFADAELPQVKAGMADLFGQLTGGPEKYAGRDMKTTHAGMGIHDDDFDALIEDLKKALGQAKVGERDQAELIALLTALRKDIVEH